MRYGDRYADGMGNSGGGADRIGDRGGSMSGRYTGGVGDRGVPMSGAHRELCRSNELRSWKSVIEGFEMSESMRATSG